MVFITLLRILLILVLTSSPFTIATPCTRILNADNSQAILVGRTMDWAQDMQTNLFVYPQGLIRDGMASVNSQTWTTKYGSIVATAYDTVTTDGMNEVGLAVHVLWLNEADYGRRDAEIPGISVALWAQYYLDNFATVNDAVNFAQKKSIQIEALAIPTTNEIITVHLALEDARGDSAIIEYTNGNLHIYHNRHYQILTNSPAYHQQLNHLQQYKEFGGDKPLPGTTESQDRFVRAAFYNNHLPKAHSFREAMSNLMSIIANISEPYGIKSEARSEIEPTLWLTIIDLTHKTYYFKSSTSLSFIWTNLNKFYLQPGSPIMKLDLINNPDLAADVTKNFKKL